VQNTAKEALPITEPNEGLNSTPLILQTHGDGVKDNPRYDFYEKKHFAAATILLPLLIALLAVSTVGEGRLITWRVIVFNICLAPVYFSTFVILSFYMESWGERFQKVKFFLLLIPFLAFSPFIIEVFPQVTGFAFGFSVMLVVPLIILYIAWCLIYWVAFYVKTSLIQRRNPKLSSRQDMSDQSLSGPPSRETEHLESN
jgi:hypothetical protein